MLDPAYKIAWIERSCICMTRHIATALLVGMGIAGEAPQVKASEPSVNLLSARRLNRSAACCARASPLLAHTDVALHAYGAT